MTRRIRHTADYFKGLPKADPFSESPGQEAKPKAGDKAVRMLLPEWADKKIDPSEDGSVPFPKLPEDHSWEHLADSHENPEENDSEHAPGHGRNSAPSAFHQIMADKLDEKAVSPAAIIEDDSIRMERKRTKTIDAEWNDPIQRLRSVGLEMAAKHEGSKDPAFQRTETEGHSASDLPLPGTSFALFGVRGSFGRQQVASAKVESDRLFHDKKDMHYAGLPDLKSAPLTAYRARAMKPGERYKVTTDRAILAESGLKYTPTPLPGVTSSMFHDLGPSGAVDFTVAVEGETSVEVVRGFGSKVAVTVSARDERAEPGQDQTWTASVGAFFDGSLIEYAAQNFTKLAGKRVESDLKTLEDKKRYMDQKIQPAVEEVNKYAAAKFEKRNKDSKSRVTLYEVVFDLSNSEARSTFNKLVGGTRARQIDFGALQDLPKDSGVQVVANNVNRASRSGIEKTFKFFGYESKEGRVTEKSETQRGDEGSGRKVVEECHAVVREKRAFGRNVESTTIGRAKTVHDEKSDESKTGVGFGWRYRLDDTNADPDSVGELLSFASLASQDGEAQAKLQKLFDVAGSLPRRRKLGLPIGARGLGKTSAEFEVELNAESVRRLLGHFETDDGKQKLWDALAQGYAKANNLAEPPSWPAKGLAKEGALGAIRRRLTAFKDSDGAFLTARTAMKVLEAAAAESDPIEASKIIGKAFDTLREDLSLAAGLIDVARGEDNKGVEVHFDFQGAAPLSAPDKPKDAKDAAAPDGAKAPA